MENIIISNPKKLEEIKKRISKDGIDKLHVIADFDNTLSKGAVDGNRRKTVLINKIALGGYIHKDYSQKAGKLYDRYYSIEINPKIDLNEKIKKMEEWWIKHNQLLIDSGFTLKVIKKIIKNEDPYFRKGCFELLDKLNEKNVPLIIMSSSRGVLIKGFLEKYKKMYDNIHIIANFFKFNADGKAIGYTKPVIHVFNKTETSVKELPIYDELLKRKNVILLGDSLGDVGMVEGFPYKNLIKIGFLNEDTKEHFEEYKKVYDIVITDDGNFDYINELITEIIKN